MQFIWVNPGSGYKEAIDIPERAFRSPTRLKVPVECMISRSLFKATWDGLSEAHARDEPEALSYLSNLLLSRLESPSGYVGRQLVDADLLTLNLKNEGGQKLFQTPGRSKDLYKELWDEVTTHLLGTPQAKGTLEINPKQLASFQRSILLAYDEAMGNSAVADGPMLRRFRERLRLQRVHHGISKEAFEIIKFNAALYPGWLHDRIARSFLKAAEHLYSESEIFLFRLLHFKIPNDGAFDTPLLHLPPIVSLPAFHAVRKIYLYVHGRDPLHELPRLINSYDDESLHDWREKYLQRILFTLQWYRQKYIPMAREESRRGTGRSLKENKKNTRSGDDDGRADDSSCGEDVLSEIFYRDTGWQTEDAMIDLLDKKMGNTAMLSDDEDSDVLTIATPWRQRLDKLGIPASQFEGTVHKKCTKKQAVVLVAAFNGQSPQEIADKRRVKRQTVQEILQNGEKRLKS